MESQELALLADHMGHSVNIHTDVYKLQSSLLERSKVAKILCAVENGELSRYRNTTEIDNAMEKLATQSYAADSGKEVTSSFLSLLAVSCYSNILIVLFSFFSH